MLYNLMQDPKFSVWIHIWVAECCILFLGNCDLDLVHSLRKNRVQSIYRVLFWRKDSQI